jgi:hypothetical protein
MYILLPLVYQNVAGDHIIVALKMNLMDAGKGLIMLL